MDRQLELITTRSLKQPTDGQVQLSYLVGLLKNGSMLPPPFQRKFIWKDVQVKEWVKTIIDQSSVGVIVTFQINNGRQQIVDGDYPTYLLDGMQRLNATMRFMDDPSQYGFKFGVEQARHYVESFLVSVQHRHYANFDIALRRFQGVNLGTSVNAGEYYKGELLLAEHGEYLYDEIQSIIEGGDRRMFRSQPTGRTALENLRRNALAVFLQMAVNDKQVSRTPYVKAASSAINPEKDSPIERHLAAWLAGKSRSDVESELRRFQRFIDNNTALMRDILNDVDPEGQRAAVSPMFYRHLLTICHYFKANKHPVTDTEKYIRGLCAISDNYTTRVVFPEHQGYASQSVTLRPGASGLSRLCKAFGIELEKPKRTKRRSLMPGYDHSHFDPFSTNGEGETFGEPSSLNRARGAKPVDEDETQTD